VGGEFAHLHPHSDGSLHLTLPRDLAEEVVAKGWGEPHVVVGWATLMVYGPRDPAELKVVWSIVRPRTTPRRRRASRCRS
jgi:phospholipase/carboxylesterase